VASGPNESAIRQIQPVPPYAALRPPRYGLSREGIGRLVRPDRRLRKLRSQSATLHRQRHHEYFVFESYVIAHLPRRSLRIFRILGIRILGTSDLGDRSDGDIGSWGQVRCEDQAGFGSDIGIRILVFGTNWGQAESIAASAVVAHQYANLGTSDLGAHESGTQTRIGNRSDGARDESARRI
jgi:hypothetical protein